jgi:hypothetical protein
MLRLADPQTAGVRDGKAGSVDRVRYAAVSAEVLRAISPLALEAALQSIIDRASNTTPLIPITAGRWRARTPME